MRSLNGSPKMRTSPSSGSITPMIIRIVVVFPAPFGPRRPKMPPGSMRSESASTAVIPSYRFVMPTSSSNAIPPRIQRFAATPQSRMSMCFSSMNAR